MHDRLGHVTRSLTAAGAAVLMAAVGAATASAATQTFSPPGTSAFTVPSGVTSITVTAIGAAGGRHECNPGHVAGRGARVAATVPVNPGEILITGVGGIGGGCNQTSGAGGAGGIGGGGAGGGNGTPAGSAAGGGGATYLSRLAPSPAFPSVVVVAAGGGGVGGAFGGSGGDAGAAGDSGAGSRTNAGGGSAGTSTGGGAGGTGNGAAGGAFGIAFVGGTGAGGTCAGGGGGGGYYGGGGGGAANGFCGGGGGGGGGSYTAPGISVISAPRPSLSAASVRISYSLPGSAPSPLLVGRQQQGTCTVSSHAARRARSVQRCTIHVLTTAAGLNASSASASLSRSGRVVGTGSATRLAGGRLRLVLHTASPLASGVYTLRLTPRHGRTLTTALRLS